MANSDSSSCAARTARLMDRCRAGTTRSAADVRVADPTQDYSGGAMKPVLKASAPG